MGTPDRSEPSATGTAWQDRLVELHVLTDQGDPEAAEVAAAWLAADDLARHRWDAVQRDCDLIRAGGPDPATRGTGEPS